ncbi:MAG: arginine--tRNA ligase, partial [Actinomycetota bacterium]
MSPNPDLESASPVTALAGAVLKVVSEALASGALVGDVARSLTADRVPLERPKNREHGDYATSIALTLAKSEGKAPRDIALVIKSGLEKVSGVASVEIAGPGFINITLDKSSQGAIVNRILNERENFGKVKLLSGVKINLEFISANPTGPLHLGHTRWAAVGDALASVLAAAGAEVVREFYVNDRGHQMDLFGASIRAAALEIPRPEDGYQGDYINDLAKLILTQHPDYKSLPEAEGVVAFREAGYALQLQEQKDV